ncbi:1-phosphofructokinase family hexose kinase [Mucilaginibacter sp.]
MKHIVTITLSPTIDKSTSVEKLMPDHKLACEPAVFEPGGGGINVSRALKRLNVNSVAIFPSGGITGQLLEKLLKEERINYQPVLTENMTRQNFIVVDRSVGEQYRFGMPAVALHQKEEREIVNAIKQLSPKPKFIVISGSMPPGMHNDFIAKIARIARQDDARLIVDTSGEALKSAVEEGVYLLKPNQNELGKLTGIKTEDEQSVTEAARQIIDRGKCEIIVVSMGELGAVIVTKDYSELIPAPQVPKRSTVGAGDSMVAGLVYGCEKGMNIKQMARMGIACGSATTMNPGTELFNRDEAMKLYEQLLKV